MSHFSLIDIDHEHRADALAQRFAAGPLPLAVRFEGTPRLAVDIDANSVGDDVSAMDVCITSTPLELRHARSPSASPEHVVVLVSLGGASEVEQHGRQYVVRPGEVFLGTTEFPLTAAATGYRRWMSLMIPYDALRLPRATIRGALGMRLGADHPVAPAAHGFFRNLSLGHSAPGSLAALREPTIALTRALVAATVGDEGRLRPALAETVFERAMEHIRARAMTADLSADRLAAALGISRRYLYRILSDHGVSLGDTVRELRMQEARRMLRGTTLNVSAIAHSLGFADHAHFTRTFRRVHGQTPTDWRRTAADHRPAGAAGAA